MRRWEVVRRLLLGFGIAWALLVSGPAAAAEPRIDLDGMLPARHELAGVWDVVDEVTPSVSADPDLVRWGVRAQRARHYTRATAHDQRVCSIEIWRFESAGRAQAALDGFAAPAWHFERVGPLLIMTRGLVNETAGAARRGVFPDCRSLAARVRERAAARLP